MLDDRFSGPGLSASERRRLDELERWFITHDPELADALRHGHPPRPGVVTRLARAVAFVFAGPLLLILTVVAMAVFGLIALAVAMVLSAIMTMAVGLGTHRRSHQHRHQHGRDEPHPG